jgi:hypothetical protein
VNKDGFNGVHCGCKCFALNNFKYSGAEFIDILLSLQIVFVIYSHQLMNTKQQHSCIKNQHKIYAALNSRKAAYYEHGGCYLKKKSL